MCVLHFSHFCLLILTPGPEPAKPPIVRIVNGYVFVRIPSN